MKTAIFARFDQDGDGEITAKEVWQVFREQVLGRKPEQKDPPPADLVRPAWNSKDQETEAAAAATASESPLFPAAEKPPQPSFAIGSMPSMPPPAPPQPESGRSGTSSVQWPVEQEKGQSTVLSFHESQQPVYPSQGSQFLGQPSYIPGSVNTAHSHETSWPPAGKPQPPLVSDYSPSFETGKSASGYGIPGGDDYGASLYGSKDDDDSTDKPRTKLRVGLRAPENEERTKITLLTDLYGHSCRSVYLYYCKQYETKPKPQVRLALPDTPNEFTMEELILNETTLIGNKGLLPVLEVVRLNTRMKALSVIGNGIKNTGVEWLVHMALDHPSLASIDLSDNRITNAAGTVLNYLAQRNVRIIDINIANTRIDEQLKHHIELRLKTNREQLQ
eukprot:NODE_1650_length_1457_cov_91.597301_g1491_i0.p1 GENE.NODE_1650_length_1457_cov_91.597301_g1491_i0~~NODE_1650_length_1457_cov_91.597301_g1491_i0.p1  ORF type:complete len:440 (-),score=84.91 NODE_1650_length_1457_cov_91.597301_g1491_i0:138-1307(-)